MSGAMRKTICLIAGCIILLSTVACARDRKDRKNYIIGFYNLENLFDTTHDEGKNDKDFTPEGRNAWTQDKYEKKLHNMAVAIAAMAKDNGAFHTALGIAEVENSHAIKDLLAQPELAPAGYRFVHYESPDSRGIDVALLYRPDKMKVIDSEPIKYDFNSSTIKFEYTPQEQAAFRTRHILMVHGLVAGEDVAIYVCHLPSRLGDKGQDLRARGAEIIYDHAMGMMQKYPGIKIIVMGDMNDNPTDESMTEYLHGREHIAEVGPEDFFSPFMSMFKAGYGTLSYRGVWNIFDCILVNEALVNAKRGLRIVPATGEYYGRVYNADFLTNQSGRYKGTPFRTFSGGEFIDGYSDHYPTFIILKR